MHDISFPADVFLLGQFNKFNCSALAPPFCQKLNVQKKMIRLE